jgi:hypothetical protein
VVNNAEPAKGCAALPLFIVCGAMLLFISGCALNEISSSNDYLCVKIGSCDLPESRSENESLVYLIRPVHLINSDETHEIYVREDSGREILLGKLSSSVYCTLHTRAKTLVIRSTGARNEPVIEIDVSVPQNYYLLYSVKSSIFSRKLSVNLSRIDEEYGEKLLREDVMAKCLG